MDPSVRKRRAKWFGQKSNFMKFGTLVFGAPMAVTMLYVAGWGGGLGWWLSLVAISFGGGWLWSYFMWPVLEKNFRRIEAEALHEQEAHDA
jgi:hypothetical protein